MKESTYSKKIVDYVAKRGGMTFVNTASMFDKAGRPDIEILYKGTVIFAELKTDGYEPTNLQIAKLAEIRNQGLVGVVLTDTLDELDDIFHLIDTGHISTYEQPTLPAMKCVDLFEEE